MLAIAAWVKRTSRRAQGWAGEKDRTDRAIQPSQVAALSDIDVALEKTPSTFEKGERQASLEGALEGASFE